MQKSTETLRFHFLVYMVTLSITYRYVYGRNMNSDFFSRRHKQSYYKD